MWSARMEYILNNTLLALLEYPDSTLLGVNRMLADKTYRKRVVANISDVAVRSFWEDEFANYSDRYMTEAGASIQNKIGQFISNPLIRNIVGQSRSSFDVRELMDRKKILLINLSKGKVGEDNANLLGSMLITKIYLSAMSRSDVSPYELKNLPQFYFYVDEFQSFANESFADILSEARKYNLSLTIAHQYIEQMTDEVRAAVFGNVGTMATFRVGATDAEVLEREFAPTFEAQDIVNLGFAQIYLRLMIDGVGSKPFSATTLPPIPVPEQSFADLVIRRSREAYALKRSEVEEQLATWHESHAGLIDDPHVLRKREKENEKKEKHIEAYRQSRQNLDSKSVDIPNPNGGKNKGSIKPEGGTNPDLNQRLQKAIAKTQVNHDSNKGKTETLTNNDKKAGTKESLTELRSTLADVLKDAGLSVPDKRSNKNDKSSNDNKSDNTSESKKNVDEKKSNKKDARDAANDQAPVQDKNIKTAGSPNDNADSNKEPSSNTKDNSSANDTLDTKSNKDTGSGDNIKKQVKSNNKKSSADSEQKESRLSKSQEKPTGDSDENSNKSPQQPSGRIESQKSSKKDSDDSSKNNTRSSADGYRSSEKENYSRNTFEIPRETLEDILKI